MFESIYKFNSLPDLLPTFRDAHNHKEIHKLRELAQIIADKEEKLKKSETILRSVMDVCPVGLVMVDKRNVIWANQVALALLGYEQDDVGITPTSQLYANDTEYERVGEYIYLRHMDDNKIGKILTQLKTKTGKILDALLTIRFVNGNTDTIVCAIYNASNIEQICNSLIYNGKLNGT